MNPSLFHVMCNMNQYRSLCFFLQTMFSIDGDHLASDFHHKAHVFTDISFSGMQTAMKPFVEVKHKDFLLHDNTK